MSTTLRFTNGGEPTEDERRDIANAYTRWSDATEGGSIDEELDAARDLIEQLMAFGSIEADEADEDDEDDETRECAECGDEVGYLSSRDWCDGCEERDAKPKCDECDTREGDVDHLGHSVELNRWPNLREPVQLCPSCEHNARRSGWEPGQ